PLAVVAGRRGGRGARILRPAPCRTRRRRSRRRRGRGRPVSWRGVVILVLLVAAIASGWSAWRQRADVPDALATSDRSDYVLEDCELVSLDSRGQEAFTLRAPWLQRDPADETLALREPVFLLPEEGGEYYWDLRGDAGWISADSSEMRLDGHVVAVSDPAGGRAM